MADSESDSSSIDGGPVMMPPSPITRDNMQKRIESLQQQNRVLKVELETERLRSKGLTQENHRLLEQSVKIVSLLIANDFLFLFYFSTQKLNKKRNTSAIN